MHSDVHCAGTPPLRRRVVLKSASNGGVDYGVMHAMEEAYPMLAAYDLVVHLHPDVLVYDCEALEVFCPWRDHARKEARWVLSVSAGWASPSSRSLWGVPVCPRPYQHHWKRQTDG
jgi:hypothetical protein